MLFRSVGVKGVRDAKESKSVSCKVGFKMVSSFRLQDVASMEWWPTRHVVLQRVLVRWSIPVYQAVVMSPCSSSRLKRPSVGSPVLPVNGLLEDKTKVHVAGVPLSSIRIDCRLVVPFGCDVVVYM